MGLLRAVLLGLRALLADRAELAAENLALRQQLAVLRHSVRRPRLGWRDRLFWVCLSRIWSGWKATLLIVQPDTVVRWHRAGWRLFWRWKSGCKPGRPALEREVRDLIRRLSRENPLWGVPRIQAELRLLGYEIAESTVAKYRVRSKGPPSPTWKAFLKNHLGQIAAVDFFTVPTATFRTLFCFLVLRLDRRRVVHFNVTANPTAEWTAQQIVEAFPYDTAPRFLIRDRDSIYGDYFRRRVKNMGIEEVVIAPRSPWQNPYAERVIGTIRRECTDHMIVLGEEHLRRILDSYLRYYHECRPHQSLSGDAPEHREVEPPAKGRVIGIPKVGGLHHRYKRIAA